LLMKWVLEKQFRYAQVQEHLELSLEGRLYFRMFRLPCPLVLHVAGG